MKEIKRQINMQSIVQMQKLFSQGMQLAESGHYERALPLLESVLTLDATHPEALNALAEVHRLMGQLDQALAYADQNINNNISSVAAYFNTRGVIYFHLGQYTKAESDYLQALKLDKNHAAAYSNLINVYRLQDKTTEVLKISQKAEANKIINADLLNNIGSFYYGKSEISFALGHFEKAYEYEPSNQTVKENLIKSNIILKDVHGIEALILRFKAYSLADSQLTRLFVLELYKNEKIVALEKVIGQWLFMDTKDTVTKVLLDEDVLNVCFYVANYYQKNGNHISAKKLYENILSYRQNNEAALNNFGSLEFNFNYFESALTKFEAVVKINPKMFMAHRNAGASLLAMNKTAQAMVHYQKAHECKPNDQHTIVQILQTCLQIADWSDFYKMRDKLSVVMKDASTDTLGSLQILSMSESIKEQFDYLKLVSGNLFKKNYPFNHNVERKSKSKKIKLAYFSFDFKNHPVSYLTVELYGLHNRDLFEIYAYSYGPDDGSEYRDRIKSSVDHFVDLKDKSIHDTAQIIYKDNIDILIDLTGNTQHTRSEILTYRIADIQMHWLGYIATMGADCYDYIVSDAFTTPPEYDQYYSEKIFRMPVTLQPNDRQRKMATSTLSRKEHGLPETGFVFCNFGQIFKIQPKMFESWMKILKQVPGSVLWLAEQDPLATGNLYKALDQYQIDRSRLVFAKRLSIPDYLARFQAADLMLDTYPVGSGTSASDSLWAGCPLISLAGEIMYSRMCGGILNAANLSELICHSHEEYVEKAIDYGLNPTKLTKLKSQLRSNRESLALFDTPAFVKQFEVGLVEIHHLQTQNQKPQSINVPLGTP